MRPVVRLLYEAAGQLATGLTALAPAGDNKIARSLRARRGLDERLARWGAEQRDRNAPLLWMHAPSVGEGLQARPILEIAREREPSWQLAYTFFSPSAEKFAKGLAVDFRDYLPFDTEAGARHALDALRPTALIYSKLDVWPLITESAARRGVALGLVSATLPAMSSRSGPWSAAVLRDAYARLDLVGAISDDDASRLEALGVRREALVVTGDTRYDQVWRRAEGVDVGGPLLAPLVSDRPTLVAGSTWPSDERVLLPAWIELRRALPTARLVIAPHEPHAGHLAPIENWAAHAGLSAARLDDPRARDADVVVVDRVGVLGDLYALATAAWVGGGFHAAGLHSVLEPAAFGAPVLFGPRHHASRDASLMLAAGAARSVTDVDDARAALSRWLADPAERAAAGEAARSLVRRELGASERAFELVKKLMGAA